MDFESALKKIGEFGHYQRLLYMVVNIVAMPVYAQYLVAVFAAAQPKWTCVDGTKDLCDKEGSICDGHVYKFGFTSIATEWGLVCSSAYKTELAQSLFMFGSLLGGLVIGGLSDKYGRKKVWLVCIICGTAMALISAFAPNLNLFLLSRLVNGFFAQGVGLVTFVLATELIGGTYRAFAGMYVQVFFAVALALLGWLAHMIRNWRALMVALVAPQIVTFFFLHWVPESPRWLLINGRVQEAEDILTDVALANGIENPKITLDKGKTNGKPVEKTSYGISDLFCRRRTQVTTAIVMFSFFVNGLCYYGLSINVKNLGGSMYVNFVLAALVEIPSYVIAVPLVERFGRRNTTFGFTFGAAVACWCCMKYQEAEVLNSFMISTTAMLGKFCASAAGGALYTYAVELFPTVIRNMALGFCSVSSRIGAIAAPFVVILGNGHRTLPMLLFAGFSLLAAVASLKLPETKGRMLPETFEDIDKPAVFGIQELKLPGNRKMTKTLVSPTI